MSAIELPRDDFETSPKRRWWPNPLRELRDRRAINRRLAALDPETDFHEISRLVVGRVFADAFFNDALFTVAYWRQIAVRTIAPVLHQSGRGKTYETTKRVDDTLLFFGFLYRDGWKTRSAAATIDRLAAIHERFQIPPSDFRYTLSGLCFEAVRIPQILGCEVLSAGEARALFLFWREVGRRWGVEVPEEQAEFRAWMEHYEATTYERTLEGPGLATAMGDDFCKRFFPGPLRTLGYTLLRCCADGHLLDTVGQPHPSGLSRKIVGLLVRAYAAFRRLVPASAGPQLLRDWNHEYGEALNPMIIGPEWAKKIRPEDRRHAKAGQCPFAAAKTAVHGTGNPGQGGAQ